MTEEPEVKVPAPDKAETLREEATRGVDAINALYAERNSATELAADLNQKLNLVQARNVELREELNYYKQQCLYLQQANARLGAYCAQQHDTFQRIAHETSAVNAAVASLPQPAPMSNNPDLPRVNVVGLPVKEEPELEKLPERQFDHNGIPYNQASQAPMVSHEDLQAIIRDMQKREAAGHA
ncbi:MAG: hypothetical protein ABW003_17265 [Microvirga sp.]